MLSLDTETTGLDLRHGAKPFFVTICNEDGSQIFYQWDVDPLTRQPLFPSEDLEQITDLIIRCGDCIVGQNLKFDAAALGTIGLPLPPHQFPWPKVHDTLIAGHLLASNKPHNLTDMAMQYLGVDIQPLEKKLEATVQECRRIVRRRFPHWRIAKEGLPEMPSVKEKTWAYDMWLPRALAVEREIPEQGHEHSHWWTVLQDYSNADSAVTLALWQVMAKLLRERGLWQIYLERMKLPPIISRMESHGIGISKKRLQELRTKFSEESEQNNAICVNIAKTYDYDLTLPKSGNNKSLITFCFGNDADNGGQGLGAPYLDLPPEKWGKKAPSLDKGVMDYYEATLPPGGKQAAFVRALSAKRKRDTAQNFMDSYERFMVPLGGDIGDNRYADQAIIYSSLNQTGTDTLRMSMSNPNAQQISKKEGLNLRYLFGPLPDREWWPMDYENLELRIPGYEAGEQAMIDLFERPDDPPYFGSYHLLNADTVYPDLFRPLASEKGAFKRKYGDTWYQWIKNAGFALIYGCQRDKFDSTAKRPGAYDAIRIRLPALFRLSDSYAAFANKHGYVETIPDRTVDPKRGYPILCGRSEWGRVSPTEPFNYHVQSTAMWCTSKAMVRIDQFFQSLNRGDIFLGRKWVDPTKGMLRHYWLALQVHDELVPDCPSPPSNWRGSEKWKYNWPVIRHCRKLMEQSGEDIGIPLKVAVSYCQQTWNQGKVITAAE